jgi:hypothetical protein
VYDGLNTCGRRKRRSSSYSRVSMKPELFRKAEEEEEWEEEEWEEEEDFEEEEWEEEEEEF